MLTPLGKSLSGNWRLLGSDQPVVCELTVSPHSTQVLHPACGPFSAMEKVTMETEEQTSYLYRTYSFLTFFLPPSFLPFLFSPSFSHTFCTRLGFLLLLLNYFLTCSQASLLWFLPVSVQSILLCLVPILLHFSVTRLAGGCLCIHPPSQGDSKVYRDGDMVLFLLKGNVKRPQGPVVSVCLCRLGRGGSDGWLGWLSTLV